MKFAVVVALLAASVPFAAHAQVPLASQVFIPSGQVVRPVWVGQAPGDNSRFYVVEQKQFDIEIFIGGVKNAVPFLDLDATKVLGGGNEQGLLGLAFHPDFANNKTFYVYYTLAGNAVAVERYTATDADHADPLSGTVIFGPLAHPQTNHNGGNIAFGPDGKLYIGIGDGGNANDSGPGHVAGGNAQATGQALGKMHRINDDGSIPGDNPFIGNPNFVQSIWDYGVRNPWRWSFDRQTGDLWIGDVGQDAIEEIDFEPAGTGGRNYGWRCMEGFSCTGLSGCTCNAVGLTLPVHDYSHAGGKCSVTGGYRYRGTALTGWQGRYFFADYCTGQIFSLVWNGVTATVTEITADIAPTGTQITTFGEDNDGEIYWCNQGGTIRKLVAESPWTDLGNALAGVSGNPVLTGTGTLVTGSAGSLNFSNIAPSAAGMLFIGLGQGAVPFKGGVLVPTPIILMLPMASDGAGAAVLPWASWPSMPSLTTIVFQAGFSDLAAVSKVSLTNALRAITP